MNRDDLSPFVRGYIAGILFAETDESDDQGGDPLDYNYDIEDFAPETLKTIIEDCNNFIAENEKYWKNAECPPGLGNDWTVEHHAGYDLWLTSRGHGVGYWETDRKEMYGKENAQALDKAAKSFGEKTIYIGDDGLLYFL